jgi:hypothetical protein
MKAVIPRIASLGIDTVATITDELLDVIVADPRIEYVGRYIDSITPDELARITARKNRNTGNGLLVTLFTYANELNPAPRVAKMRALGVPAGVTAWIDVEGEQLAPQELIGAINVCGRGFRDGGFDPGEYCGAGEVLTSVELTALIVDRYAHACSKVQDVGGLYAEPASGFCLFQGYPPNQRIRPDCPLLVDWSCIFADYKGRLPTMIGA